MPVTERTLVLVKPDGVQRLLIGRILARYEERGLKIVGLKLVRTSRDLAERHYAVHRERPFFGGLVDFITSSPARRPRPRGPERHRRRPRDQRRDPPARGRPGHDPRRLRARDRPEHRPRVGRPRGRRGRARPVVRARRAARVRAVRRPLGAPAGRVAPTGSGRSTSPGIVSAGGSPAAASGPPNAPIEVASAASARTSDSVVTPSTRLRRVQPPRPSRARRSGPAASSVGRQATAVRPTGLSSRRAPRPSTRT